MWPKFYCRMAETSRIYIVFKKCLYLVVYIFCEILANEWFFIWHEQRKTSTMAEASKIDVMHLWGNRTTFQTTCMQNYWWCTSRQNKISDTLISYTAFLLNPFFPQGSTRYSIRITRKLHYDMKYINPAIKRNAYWQAWNVPEKISCASKWFQTTHVATFVGNFASSDRAGESKNLLVLVLMYEAQW